MMTPITHPLAIAHAEASVAWSRVEFRSHTPEHTAYDIAFKAWKAAGYPLRLDPPKNTVRARAQFAVCADGTWEASSLWDGAQMHHAAGDGLNDAYRTSYAVVDVPLPEPAAEVVGSVEP